MYILIGLTVLAVVWIILGIIFSMAAMRLAMWNRSLSNMDMPSVFYMLWFGFLTFMFWLPAMIVSWGLSVVRYFKGY